MTPSDSDYHPDGGPRPISASLPKLKASTPMPSPTRSSSTGPKARAEHSSAPRTVGTGHGAAGAVAMPSAEVEERRRKTARQIGLPEAAASLVPLLGRSLAISARDVYAGREFDGYEYTATLRDDAQPGEIEAARRALARWLDPITREKAVAMLAELSVLTKRREGDADLDDLALNVYVARLAEYPLDVVEGVLRSWGGTFWPAWAELQAALDRKTRARRVFAKALGL